MAASCDGKRAPTIRRGGCPSDAGCVLTGSSAPLLLGDAAYRRVAAVRCVCVLDILDILAAAAADDAAAAGAAAHAAKAP
eukprot:scaffold66215_cov18-Tisochrysis_lutea.AAC.1